MTEYDKIAIVKNMTDEDDPDVISVFLKLAGETICNYVDPSHSHDSESIIDRYGGVQAKIAAYMLNKRGADMEKSHSENGITRTYESGDIPPSLLRELTPFCGITK